MYLGHLSADQPMRLSLLHLTHSVALLVPTCGFVQPIPHILHTLSGRKFHKALKETMAHPAVSEASVDDQAMEILAELKAGTKTM